jgi:PAS domain S-box-containing protein
MPYDDTTEAQLRLILEGVQDHAISLLDVAGCIVTWNAAAERINGYRLDEVRGHHIRILFTEDERASGAPEHELEVARREGKYLGEGDRVRKDGSVFRVLVSLSALRDSGGMLRGFVKVSHDITEQVRLRELEEIARLRIARLHALTGALTEAATASDVAAVVVDEGMRAVEASSSALWQVGPDGGLQLVAQRGVPPEFIEAWAEVSPEANVPARHVATTRQPIWVQSPGAFEALSPEVAAQAAKMGRLNAFAALPLIARRRLLGVLAYGYPGARAFSPEDRALMGTAAHHCAQALDRAQLFDAERQAKERLEVLTAASVTLASSLDYQITLSNVARSLVPVVSDWCAVDLVDERGMPKLVALAHADSEKVVLGHELRRRYPPRPSDPLLEVIRSGEAVLYPVVTDEMLVAGAIDEQHLRFARELGMRSAMIVPMRVRERTIGALTLVSTAPGRRYDQSDLEFARSVALRAALAVDSARLFSESEQAAQRATQANRMKDEFLATLSHELRTPLTAILGWTRMLRTGQLDPARIDRAFEAIERNTLAQAQLVEDLLDISRVVSGKLRLEVRPVDLAQVVRDAIESVRPAAEAKQIRLDTILDASADAIMGDSARLQQVVWNLLSNAVKFTTKQGRVHIALQCIDSHVELSIADTGQGIAPEFLPYVFDRFIQADATFSRTHGGLGIGLAIVRNLVEMHGGTVEAHSEGVGKGATFLVRLPRAPVRLESRDASLIHPTAPQTPSFECPAELEGLRVLVVDDEQDARDLVVTILERCGAESRAVSGVGEALAVLGSWRPQVLLCDIGMPGGDGYELIRAVRARSQAEGGRVPAAALTAYARAEDRRRALMSGYQMHVPKPVEPAELAAVVANLARIGQSIG